MGFRKLTLKMVLKQEFSSYSLFALAPCLFGRSARKSCAFCTGATTSVAPPLHQVQRGNKKKILVLKPSSRVAFESPFKTALNVRKKNQNWTVSLSTKIVFFCSANSLISFFYSFQEEDSLFVWQSIGNYSLTGKVTKL